MQGMGPQQGESTPQGEYEFTEAENGAFTDLAGKMRFVGTMGVIFGILMICAGMAGCAAGGQNGGSGFGYFIQGVLGLMVGIWTRTAAASFKKIVDTQGSDIFNLMSACSELRRIYGLQRTLYIIALVLFGLAIPLVFLLAARSSHM